MLKICGEDSVYSATSMHTCDLDGGSDIELFVDSELLKVHKLWTLTQLFLYFKLHKISWFNVETLVKLLIYDFTPNFKQKEPKCQMKIATSIVDVWNVSEYI